MIGLRVDAFPYCRVLEPLIGAKQVPILNLCKILGVENSGTEPLEVFQFEG